jgi:2-methylisocitrate lyase-like PEP mutase family enzyme
MRATTKLRQLLAAGRTVVAPGVFDGLSARLTEQAGFAAALDRAAAYGEASTDVIFVEARTTEEEIAAVARRFHVPQRSAADFGNVTVSTSTPRSSVTTTFSTSFQPLNSDWRRTRSMA